MNYTLVPCGCGPIRFSEFIKQNGLNLTVHEREREYWEFTGARYYADIDLVEVKGDGVLIGTFGDGNTPDEAIADLMEELRGMRLIVNAHGGDKRREIQAPNEWLPEANS